jgi:phage baseplate assembly protein W
MALSRADAITQTLKKVDTYSDFTTNFIKHPISNELVVVKNEDSVKQSFKNLILTNIFERFYNPFFGSNVERTLFENFGPWVVEDLNRYISVAAKQFENRIQILNTQITDNSEQNGISINIVFSILNNPEPVSINLFLKRVR